MQNILNINLLGASGTLVSTTDIKRAARLGRRISISSLLRGGRVHYERTTDSTILIYAGRELYELEGIK